MNWSFFLFLKVLAVFCLILAHPFVMFGEECSAENQREEKRGYHFQATVVSQWHASFPARYSGQNSFFSGSESAASLTSTFFAGSRLWTNGEIYSNFELLAGNGLSSTLGIAGFPNGEIYRVDNPAPRLNLSRLFLRQVFGLGGRKDYLWGLGLRRGYAGLHVGAYSGSPEAGLIPPVGFGDGAPGSQYDGFGY